MKKVPFVTKTQVEEIAKTYPTPFYIYDEKGIRETARKINQAFSWNKGYKEYFAVKATPNPYLLKILQEEGCGTDCSSYTELLMSKVCGFSGHDIMFSSNDTPDQDYRLAAELGAIINLDDFTMIDTVERLVGIPETICCRYNPGGTFALGNDIMDNPGDSKYGMTKAQLMEAFKILKNKGAKEFGEGVHRVYDEVFGPEGMTNVRLMTEMGRFVTGPYGALVAKAIHFKHIYKEYVGLDACAANLIRPAMYGAYHHITVLGKEDAPCDHKYDVTGGLCENNDKFAVDRMLPEIEEGDYLFLHDAGAHCYAMGYNYNGKLWCAEFLLQQDGSIKMIRRAQTPKDYFATLDFTGLFDGVE